jgi:hypothetical protein
MGFEEIGMRAAVTITTSPPSRLMDRNSFQMRGIRSEFAADDNPKCCYVVTLTYKAPGIVPP